MANLKDLLVNGPSRFIGDIIANKARLTSLEIPTTSSGSTYGLGSSGQILKTNGSSIYWADDVVSKLGTATVGSSSQPIYLNNGIPSTITSLEVEAGGTGKDSRRKAGLFYDWTASLKGQKWSRICYIPRTNNLLGSTMILNIRHTRSGVVYNETVIITVHHNSRGNITSLSSSNYNQNSSIQIRALADSSGHCYIELKDSNQGITEGTTISPVYCTLQIITLGDTEPTLKTSFEDGTTLPENYSVAAEVALGRNRIITSGIFSGNLDGNAATASAVPWSGITNLPTTIAGYGITDAKIQNGTITLGSNTITPLTSSSSLNASNINSGTINATYLPTLYWANQEISTTSSKNTNPSFNSVRLKNNIYNIAPQFSTGNNRAKETILYTGIKIANSHWMPVLHFTGYAYGLAAPIEFKVAIYYNSNKFISAGVTNMGAWNPEVYAFKYAKNNEDYVAIGFKGICYYLQMTVDIQEMLYNLYYIDTDPSAWTWDYVSDTDENTIIPEADGGVTCLQIPYKGDVLDPYRLTPHSKNKILATPANAQGIPSFRTLVADDIPNLNASKINAGILPVSYGGTGKSSFTGNRLIFSSQSSVIDNAAKIYVKNETNADAYMAINDTSIVSGYNFQVTGNSNFKGGARFWGIIELGVAAETAGQIIRVGRSSNWYNGRDKAIISMTSNATGYNPFMSIRADGNSTDSTITGTWDIGVNKYNSNYQNELIFSYITDTAYDNQTNAAPSNQIRFKQNGIVKASEFEGNLTGTASKATNVDWSGITNKPITFTPPIASSNILGGIKEGNGIDIDSSGVASVNLSELGLSSAMHFKGITTTAMSDGLTTAAVIINNTSYTPSSGDVVLYSDSEFVWTGSSWESLGRDSSFKITQTAVADVAATDEEATAFISSITQNSNGVISATKKKLPNVVTYTQNNNVSVPGAGVGATTTKTVYKYNQTTIFTPNGLIIGGTAQNAGLATRGICGISIPNNNTGAATKDHLYINYDGNNTYRSDRQLILQADGVGTYYGNNVYQYAAVRGDAMKAWVEAKGYSTTDEKVKQNIETSNANYPILFSYSTSPTSGTNEYVKYTDKITINPYNGCISPSTSSLYDLGTNSYWWGNVYGEYFSGNAETATTAGGITSAGTTAQFWRGDNTWSNILKQNNENLWTSEDAANLRLGTTLKTLHIATENNINSGAGVHQGKSAGITFGDQSNAYAGIYYQSANNYGSRLYFATTNSFNNGAYARMMITHDGKVGIGTTNPSSLLHVNGNVYTNHIYPNNFNNNNYSNYNLGDSEARWNKIYVKEFEPDILLQSINITLSNSWSNIQSGGTDITLPYDGTYIIQIYDNTTSIHQYVYWSGMFSWYTGDISGITNSNGYEYSEILLHGAGRAINSKNIYLRTYSSNGSKMKLQIKGNNNLTSSSSNIISIKIKYIM